MLSYQLNNYKIELKGLLNTDYSLLYKILIIELKLMKEFFIKNLEKRFIKLSTVLYVLLILFVIKKDGIKCSYMDYRKLNVFIRKNCYFILKIDETL